MINPNTPQTVQGVQGVQGQKSTALHGYKPRMTRLCAWLCKVCKTHVRGRARTHKNNTTKITNLSRVYIPPAHPAHPAQTNNHATYSRAGSIYQPLACLHALHTHYFFMTKHICTKDNVREINELLKKELPEFYALVKELHKNGLIDGLRGIEIEILDGKPPEQPKIAKQWPKCGICQHFKPRPSPTQLGTGNCAKIGPEFVIWPTMQPCNDYEDAQ